MRGLDGGREAFAAGAEISGEGEIRPRILVSGWAGRVRVLPDGRRQILALLLPGDVMDLQREHPLALAPTVALTRVEAVDAAPLAAAVETSEPASLAAACRAATGVEEALLLDQVVRLGRQTAYERVIHLFLELHARLEAVGLAGDGRFPMPLSQEVLGDVLGLSLVHVNRTLQQLRRDRLLETGPGEVRLGDAAALAALVDFRPPLSAAPTLPL